MYAVVTHEWTDKVRVDFFLEPHEPFHDQYYVRQPARELTEKELVKLTKDGVIDKAVYEAYVEKNIGWKMVNTPFNCHFMTRPKTVEDLDDAVVERVSALGGNVAACKLQGEAEIKLAPELSKRTVIAEKYPDGMVVDSFLAVEVS